jgi:hypothetical protein
MKTLPPAHEKGKREAARNILLEAALSYAARGWAVLPVHTPMGGGCSCLKPDCTSIGKHPRNYNGATGASRDQAKIRHWWTKWPTANVGIATGASSGLLVIDVDGEAGQASMKALGQISDTLRADSGRTGSDGKRNSFHLFFEHPPGANLRSGVGALGKGLDIRANGGYVVAAPSLHRSGLAYQWVDEDRKVAPSPVWLVDAAKAAAQSVPTGGTHFFYEGQRNKVLYRLAARWRRKEGLDEYEIKARLRAINQRRCREPLPENDIATIAWSAAKQPIGGLDPLDLAWKEAEAEGHYYAWEKFLAIIRHLYTQNPGALLLLPLERIGRLIGCDHTLVSRFRRKAIAAGFIQEAERYVAHELATKFKVLSLPRSEALLMQCPTKTEASH